MEQIDNRQSITIRSAFDVILARMRVRQQARAAGFGIQGQACIALATSLLARALRLGDANEGCIDIYHSVEGNIRVVCTGANGSAYDPGSQAFVDTRWMVDELTVETLPTNDVKVTLVKWPSRRNYA
jgi:hypothetical protein